MSEITRVPLQPVARGSNTRIWVGLVVALLIAFALAFAARSNDTVVVTTLKPGTGPSPTAADVVLVNYVGHLSDGKEFDKGDKVAIPLEGVVPGFTEGLTKMQKGGRYKLFIPAKKAYGAEPQTNRATGQVVIPANSDLTFDIELIDYMNAAQLRQLQQLQMQQLQSMRGRGGPGGMPPGAMPPGAVPPPPAGGQ